MWILIFFAGTIIGFILNRCSNKVSYKISNSRVAKFNMFVPLITGIIFLISFLKFEISVLFMKSIALGSILIVVSLIDIRHRIIPNMFVILTLILGIMFCFIGGGTSLYNSILGMLIGGGFLFILALIPGAMGGGDIKFMFALGSFLGYTKTLWALVLAFIFAAVFSIILLILKIKHRKDYIPFGPFIAMGTFISFLFLK